MIALKTGIFKVPSLLGARVNDTRYIRYPMYDMIYTLVRLNVITYEIHEDFMSSAFDKCQFGYFDKWIDHAACTKWEESQ